MEPQARSSHLLFAETQQAAQGEEAFANQEPSTIGCQSNDE
jgi:hypothetical protein